MGRGKFLKRGCGGREVAFRRGDTSQVQHNLINANIKKNVDIEYVNRRPKMNQDKMFQLMDK